MRNLFAPRFLPGAEEIVFVATGSVQAPMQPSAVIVEKIKHKHSQKKSSFPLPSLTSALPPCSRPLEFIKPLATRAKAWQAIPGVSEWVMGIIKRGYSLQFARRPPRFSGVVSTSVHGENARILRSDVMMLLEKGAIEMVPPALSESGFTAVTSSSPKRMAASGPSSISDAWITPSWDGRSGWSRWSRSSRRFAQGTGSVLWTWKMHTFTSR